jgi:chemotaxis protein MotB
MATAKPIIVIKKKGGHGGHHGGAWKVAYADFVTAMMALFIVLWLLNSSQKVQKAVGGYFRDPSGTTEQAGSDMNGVAENFVTKDNMDQIKEQLEKTIREVPDFEKLKNNIDLTVTNEGLRIELTESATGTFFDSGSSKISPDGVELLGALGGELGKLPNTIAMEGHTDSKPYSAASSYTNWELSSDRANAARRLMLQHGIRTAQVTQVRGFADQRLRKKEAPLDPSSRRISLIVQYLPKKPTESDAKGEKGGENKSEGGEEKSEKPEAQPAEKK